jgi:hypothetical protein
MPSLHGIESVLGQFPFALIFKVGPRDNKVDIALQKANRTIAIPCIDFHCPNFNLEREISTMATSIDFHNSGELCISIAAV